MKIISRMLLNIIMIFALFASSVVLAQDCSFLDDLDFMGDTTVAPCPPLRTTFEILPPHDQLEYQLVDWNFGNGRDPVVDINVGVYTNIGPNGQNGPFYDVSLKVETIEGCEKEITKSNYVEVGGPGGDFTITPDSGCVGDFATYSHNTRNAIRYFWAFHNGTLPTSSASDNDFQRKMELAGIYKPALVIEDDQACRLSIEGKELRVSNLIAYTQQDSILIQDQGTVILKDSSYFDLSEAISDPGDFVTNYEWELNGNLIAKNTDFIYDFTSNDFGKNTLILSSYSSFGCSNSDTITIEVIAPTLIRNSNFQEQNLFPNPSSSYLQLDKNIEHTLLGQIFNLNGELIREVEVSTNHIDISFLENGHYFLSLKGEEKVYVAKFVKVE